jgi:hypothetical protein
VAHGSRPAQCLHSVVEGLASPTSLDYIRLGYLRGLICHDVFVQVKAEREHTFIAVLIIMLVHR